MQVNMEYSYSTAKEAFAHMENGAKTVVLYDYSQKVLEKQVKKLYKLIREYNLTVVDDKSQILPSNPYYYRGIKGCLGVACAEITGGLFSDNVDKLMMLGGWNNSVLRDGT